MKNSAHCTEIARIRQRIKTFRREEDGSMVYFGLFIVMLMMLLGGIGVDMMNAEMKRTKLQDTLDSAVLAAAALEQDLPAEDVVEDYFAKTDLSEHLKDITVEEGIGYKSVTATAETTMATQFMKLAGVDQLAMAAASAAEESIGGVEISLVLDVSGSMGSNSRLYNLQIAAKDFITTLTNTTEEGKLSISIVPYATQVSIPDELADHMNLSTPLQDSLNDTTAEEFANCVNFAEADFAETAIDHDQELERTLLFDPWYNYDGRLQNPSITIGAETSTYIGSTYSIPVCIPDDGSDTAESRHVQVLQNDELALHDFIDNMYAEGNTSLDLGMKWGTALLDPSMQGIIADMVTDGDVSADFVERPYAYDSGETLKVLVLMTDGANTSQYYIEDGFREGASNVFWNEEAGVYSIYIGEDTGDEDGDGVTDEPMYYWPHEDIWVDHHYGEGQYLEISYENGACESYRRNGSCRYYEQIEVETVVDEEGTSVNLSYPELWAYTSVEENADENYAPWMGSSAANSDWYDDVVSSYGTSTKDTRTLTACSAAKNAGILVFTIAFEASAGGEAVLQECASSDSHYYDVNGLEISDAFAAIASSIRQLRLVQ